MNTDRRAQIVESLKDKEARDAFVEAHIETGVSFQIRANRLSRELTQAELGSLADMKQTAISRLESPDHGLPKLETLTRLASAFDVALVVRFVPFSELLEWGESLGTRNLAVKSFGEDRGLAAPGATTASVATLRLVRSTQQITVDKSEIFSDRVALAK